MLKVKKSRRKASKVGAHYRKVKGKGKVRVKASRRKAGSVKAHTARKAGTGIKVRNGVGTMVYKRKPGAKN